jgi:uncharacterized protein DUF4276
MARLYLTVEGQTEQAFATSVLGPHLAQRNVFLWKPRLTGPRERKRGHIPAGGLRKFEPVLKDIQRWLKEDQQPDAYFSTMIDLYALPADFPGYSEAKKLNQADRRITALEEAFASEIGDPRFIPYLQLHEFEALLLSKPSAFSTYYEGHDQEIQELAKIRERFKTPEHIDDGFETAPSKRIGQAIPAYLGAKPTAGPIIAARIGLETLRSRCPHFGAWLERLERLGTPAI